MSEYILNKDYFINVITDLIALAEEKKNIFQSLTLLLEMAIMV